MTNDEKLMQQALEALELLAKYENPLTKIQVRKPRDGGPIVTMYPHKVATEAAAPLRERLAQPAQQQEPVAWRYKIVDCFGETVWTLKTPKTDTRVLESEPLYTSPPASKPWVGLTDEEKNQVAWSCGSMSADWLEFAEAIEAKLQEKNA